MPCAQRPIERVVTRKIMFETAGRSLDDPAWDGADATVADVLLEPSVIYTPAVLAVAQAGGM